QFLARVEGALARLLGEFVPWADGKAIVAAIDAVAHRLAELKRDMTLVLDGQVGNAAARIEFVRLREGLRRTGIETAAAGAAMILMGLVGLDFERREDRAEKEPGAEFARDEIGVLALPA